jgi:hypothetical protein
MSVNPIGMTLLNWADAVILTTNDAWAFGKLNNEADWQTWATGFVRASPFTQRTLPDPFQFRDWREWAMRVYPMLEERN